MRHFSRFSTYRRIRHLESQHRRVHLCRHQSQLLRFREPANPQFRASAHPHMRACGHARIHGSQHFQGSILSTSSLRALSTFFYPALLRSCNFVIGVSGLMQFSSLTLLRYLASVLVRSLHQIVLCFSAFCSRFYRTTVSQRSCTLALRTSRAHPSLSCCHTVVRQRCRAPHAFSAFPAFRTSRTFMISRSRDSALLRSLARVSLALSFLRRFRF